MPLPLLPLVFPSVLLLLLRRHEAVQAQQQYPAAPPSTTNSNIGTTHAHPPAAGPTLSSAEVAHGDNGILGGKPVGSENWRNPNGRKKIRLEKPF